MNLSTLLLSLQTRYSAVARLMKLSFCLLFFLNMALPGYCQDSVRLSSWWVGTGGGANFNSYKGYTSKLNVDINASPAFNKGRGVGGYLAGLLEFHPPGLMWGLRLQGGWDSRMATFKEGGNRLRTEISYFSIEPGLIIIPVKSLFIYAGPRLGLLWGTGFTYKQPNAPEYPQKNINYPAYIKNLNKTELSMHAGVEYDFMFSQKGAMQQFIIAPFITYLPSLNQNLRTIETLKLNTLRAGILIKAGLD